MWLILVPVLALLYYLYTNGYFNQLRLRGSGVAVNGLGPLKLLTAVAVAALSIYMLGSQLPTTGNSGVLQGGSHVPAKTQSTPVQPGAPLSGGRQTAKKKSKLTPEQIVDPEYHNLHQSHEDDDSRGPYFILSMIWPAGYCYDLRTDRGEECTDQFIQPGWVIERLYSPQLFDAVGPVPDIPRDELTLLEIDLQQSWPSYKVHMGDFEHWNLLYHEDGAAMIGPNGFKDIKSYFDFGLSLESSLQLTMILEDIGFDQGYGHIVKDLIKDLKATYGKVPSVGCRNDTVPPMYHRIEFCYDRNSERVDCIEQRCHSVQALLPSYREVLVQVVGYDPYEQYNQEQ